MMPKPRRYIRYAIVTRVSDELLFMVNDLRWKGKLVHPQWEPYFVSRESSRRSEAEMTNMAYDYLFEKTLRRPDLPDIKLIKISGPSTRMGELRWDKETQSMVLLYEEASYTLTYIDIDMSDKKVFFINQLIRSNLLSMAKAFEKINMAEFNPPRYVVLRKGGMKDGIDRASDDVRHSGMYSFFWSEDEYNLIRLTHDVIGYDLSERFRKHGVSTPSD